MCVSAYGQGTCKCLDLLKLAALCSLVSPLLQRSAHSHAVHMQDRCHRIGQTREVHIYRLISHHTIEENILRKSNQKRHLDHLAIQSGGYSGGAGPSGDSAAPAGGTSTGAGMGAADIREMLGADLVGGSLEDEKNGKKDEHERKDTDKTAPDQSDLADEEVKKAMASAEDDADALAASAAEKELAEENAADFDDGGEGTDGKTDGPAVLKATATDAHSMLKPIEKYAVRVGCESCSMCILC